MRTVFTPVTEPGQLDILAVRSRLRGLVQFEQNEAPRVMLLGGATATPVWSRVAHAQRAGRVPTVGVLWYERRGRRPYFTALIGFSALGYIEGRNIKFEHRFPNEMPERFKSMAAELVSLNVDVLVSVGGEATRFREIPQ
jgi:hypothetical protein